MYIMHQITVGIIGIYLQCIPQISKEKKGKINMRILYESTPTMRILYTQPVSKEDKN
jgi:hypothetical protein